MVFADLTHLKQLQRELWSWPRSRASVMVGAGFSFNAVPLAGVTKSFPSWSGLSRVMYDELNPIISKEAKGHRTANRDVDSWGQTNPLRIASEYEAAFGRRKLEHLIQVQIPDQDYQPGKLHELLLQLPWADVFTTNYDTLLERTEIHGRAYQPVTKASELTSAFPPRIVKLHGSLPSETPFICSEEDYRTYPRKFSPFINTVQQSLLENTFVLIGFSGEDPNFLEWTGWIRDELEGKHAPIYLVGALALGNAARSLLNRRGVTPIDLAPLFSGEHPREDIHAASTEWFLRYLAAARPPRPEKWPQLEREAVPASPGLPDFPEIKVDTPPPVHLQHAGPQPIDQQTGNQVVARWRFERDQYPGWVIAPEDTRKTIWAETEYWIDPLINLSKEWSATDRLRIFREINWRLNTALVPLLQDVRKIFEAAVKETFDLFQASNPLAQKTILSSDNNMVGAELADGWFEIMFSLLRDAREDYDSDRWQSLRKMIEEIGQRYSKHSDKCLYEEALWAVWNGDRFLAKEILTRWQPSPKAPLPLMWKAGLLAELDESSEAETLLRLALAEIQRSLRSQGQDIGLLSLDGWCSYLLYVTGRWDHRDQDLELHEKFRERWQELQATDCSPWQIFEQLKGALAASPPKPRKSEVRIQGFDPGHFTIRRHFGGEGITPYLPGFAYVRTFEQVGIPMHIEHVDMTGEALVNACRWIAPFTGFWSPSILIRAAKIEALKEEEFLSRTRVAALDPALGERIYSWCLQVFDRVLNEISKQSRLEPTQISLLTAVTEVLSRLAIRVEPSKLRTTFPLVLRLHGHPSVRSNWALHSLCQPWFQRLFDAASGELLLEWLPDLIRAPLFDAQQIHPSVTQATAWPDPMVDFPFDREWSGETIPLEIGARISEATEWLIKRASSETGEAKKRALLRLIHVHQAKIMPPSQENQFCQLLWSDRTPSNLPNLPALHIHAFLLLPAPPDADVLVAIKQHIISRAMEESIAHDESHLVLASGGGLTWIEDAILTSFAQVSTWNRHSKGVRWTPAESQQLYIQARCYWDQHKAVLARMQDGHRFGLMSFDSVKRSFQNFGNFLATVVLPHMEWAEETDWVHLNAILQEARELRLFPTIAMPYMLLTRPADSEGIGDVILDDLHSMDEDAVAAAAEATLHWHLLHADLRVPAPPSGLLNALIERCLFRTKPGISRCLHRLSQLIRHYPQALSLSQVMLLSACLEQWITATTLSVDSDGQREFPEEELPALRARLGYLAGVLKYWMTSLQPTIPEQPSLFKWREICAADPLPEVRCSFLEGST